MSILRADQTLVQKLLDMAQELEPEPMGMMNFGVRGLILVTDTVNNALERAESIQKLKSHRMQLILAAFHKATAQGEKAALNLQNALAISLSELGILRTALDHIKMHSSNESSPLWSSWFKNAHAKEALKEVLRVDSSRLELPSSSLIEDINEAMTAYDKVRKLCKEQTKQRFRKKAPAMMVQVACIASVFVLGLVRAGLVGLEVAAAILTSGASAAIGDIARTEADKLLKELIDTLQSKISAHNTEREAIKQAESEAGILLVDMKTIQIRVTALQAELQCISSHVGVAQRLKQLAGLLEEQVHAEIVKQEASLLQLKNSCSDLVISILNAYKAFKHHGATIDIAAKSL